MERCIQVIQLHLLQENHDLAEARGVNLLGAVTWAFEFEDQPWFRGFRDLATNGVDKPVLNVFRMFGMMQGTACRSKTKSGLRFSESS